MKNCGKTNPDIFTRQALDTIEIQRIHNEWTHFIARGASACHIRVISSNDSAARL